jgi:hypothetical protein
VFSAGKLHFSEQAGKLQIGVALSGVVYSVETSGNEAYDFLTIVLYLCHIIVSLIMLQPLTLTAYTKP